MPAALLDHEHAQRAIGVEGDALGLAAGVIVEYPLDAPAQDHDGFGRAEMPVYGQHRPGLQRIQHPLRTVFGRVPQIQIHPQARRGLRLDGEVVQYGSVDYHIEEGFSKCPQTPLQKADQRLSR